MTCNNKYTHKQQIVRQNSRAITIAAGTETYNKQAENSQQCFRKNILLGQKQLHVSARMTKIEFLKIDLGMKFSSFRACREASLQRSE